MEKYIIHGITTKDNALDTRISIFITLFIGLVPVYGQCYCKFVYSGRALVNIDKIDRVCFIIIPPGQLPSIYTLMTCI